MQRFEREVSHEGIRGRDFLVEKNSKGKTVSKNVHGVLEEGEGGKQSWGRVRGESKRGNEESNEGSDHKRPSGNI